MIKNKTVIYFKMANPALLPNISLPFSLPVNFSSIYQGKRRRLLGSSESLIWKVAKILDVIHFDSVKFSKKTFLFHWFEREAHYYEPMTIDDASLFIHKIHG